MKRLIIFLLFLLGFVVYFCYWSMQSVHKTNSRSGSNRATEVTSKTDHGGDSPRPSREARLRSILESRNASIQFYGIVIDEQGNALPDVEVSWSVIKPGAFAMELGLPAGARGTVRTGMDGRFSITETGRSLGIKSLKKEGYREAQQTMLTFGYGESNSEPHEPDESHPQQFLMIKKGSAPVLQKHMHLAFDWDGTPKEFDIGIKEIRETLILVPTRSAIPENLNDLVWKLVLKLQNGQIIRAKEGDALLAPDSGYKDEIILGEEVGAARVGSATALFYVKTATGKYGQIRIDAYPMRGSEGGMTASLDICWNPAGGRWFE